MKCDECPFRGVKIYGEGTRTEGEKILAIKEDKQYDIVAVGMAPAEEENRQGRPFVGISGQILRRTLYQMGIKEYYVCNVLLCSILDDSQVKKALECCRSVVDEVLSKKPKLTIALGDLPLHTLAPEIGYKIKEVEGRVIPSKVGPLLPITHPAYYWRHPQDFFDFLECLRPGLRFLDGKYQQAVEPTLTVVTPDNLYDVLNELDKHEEITGDLETTGFFAYGWEPNSILELGLATDHKHAYIIPKKLIPEFKQLLETKKTNWWNAQFDAGFLKQIGINPNVYFDGMLAHYSIDERPYSHGLKRVAQIYLGAENWEEDIDKYIPKRKKKTVSYEVIPKEVREKYLSKDVTRTHQLKDVLMDDMNKKVFWDILMPACRMFIEIENRGMRIDPVKMMAMDGTLSEDLEKREEELYDLTNEWLNPLSPKQVSEYLYNKLNLPIDSFFGPTTSRVYLEQFREQYEAVDRILDYRVISKLKGTYIEGFARFVDKNFRIHPSKKIFGSVTGRLSSENPSIMNIKSLGKLKEIFLPDAGHVLLYSDIKMNELCWYYIYSRDEELGAVLKSGGDPHRLVTSAAYGEKRADEMRTLGKAVVFGRMYKRGRKDIERQVGHENIDLLMETVDNVFPGIEGYYKTIIRQLKTQGYLTSYFGRKRRFSLITHDTKNEIERQAVNFPIQSAGSDLMLLNMLHLFEVREKFGIWPFWPYHDSITMDAESSDILPLVKKELEDYSLELVNGVLPFKWELSWGTDWAMASKETR